MFVAQEKKFLLNLARQSIEHFLVTGNKFTTSAADVPSILQEMQASFVTLTKDFELRGCIGSLVATRPLYLDVIDNAYAAAFEDNRFFPVIKAELSEIHIEISVLTPPQPISFVSPQELLTKLTVGVDGVTLSRGDKNATYLPQVWDEILDKHDFLSSLCLKARLSPDDWQKPGINIETYQVEIINEN